MHCVVWEIEEQLLLLEFRKKLLPLSSGEARVKGCECYYSSDIIHINSYLNEDPFCEYARAVVNFQMW